MTATTAIDPQEHVGALFRAAEFLRKSGLTRLAREVEAAAEAWIDTQAERDDFLAALVDLVEEAQPLGIEREAYQTALTLVVRHHDRVCEPTT